MPARTSPDLARFVDRIQGNILEGFNKDFQNFLFLEFTDPGGAKEWLGGIAHEVASVEEVRDLNRLFKKLKRRRRGELGILKSTWMNLAFTFEGLAALGVPAADLATFPPTFRDGMKARAAEIGDLGASDPVGWIAPFRTGKLHALMILASDTQADLAEHTTRYLHNMGINGSVRLVYLQEGAVRQDQPGHEHFGFKDGVSQPAVRFYDEHVAGGEPIQAAPGQDRVHPGEFLLGYPAQVRSPKACPGAGGDTDFQSPNPDAGLVSPASTGETAPEWAVDGSYLVFRRLAQDVPGFHALVAELATTVLPSLSASDPATAGEVMGAKLVGRYASGCPLGFTKDETPLIGKSLPKDFRPDEGDPSRRFPHILGKKHGPDHVGNLAEDAAFDNHFEYGDDQLGATVPRAAHIRKAYPRDSATPDGGESDTQSHRLLRRGIPFGTSFRPSLGATGHGAVIEPEEPGDRGLLFLCYQSSLANQFEFVQKTWVNNPNFPGNPHPPDAPDPTTGLWKSDLDPTDPDGQDPIITQSTPAGPMKVPSQDGTVAPSGRFSMAHFVTTTGGSYLFQPSIEAIYVALAGLPSPFPPDGIPGAAFEDTPGGIDVPGTDPCGG